MKSLVESASKAYMKIMLKQSCEIEILINGKAAKEYRHKGKNHIEGREGTAFSIKMRNNSWERKLFVPTVDGLSIMNGEEGNFDSGGYIVDGYSTVIIRGWRKSDDAVAEFYFSSPKKSYRRKKKMGNNLGVIGVAVFPEAYVPQPNISWTTPLPFVPDHTFPGFTCDSASSGTHHLDASNTSNLDERAMCCSASLGSQPSQKLGTGWGQTKRSEVTTVEFKRVDTPETIFELYYNTRRELEEMGVNFKKAPLYVVPEAFPGRYCTPPKN